MRFLKVKDVAYYYIPIIKYAETQFTICFHQQKLQYCEKSGCTIKYGKKELCEKSTVSDGCTVIIKETLSIIVNFIL